MAGLVLPACAHLSACYTGKKPICSHVFVACRWLVMQPMAIGAELAIGAAADRGLYGISEPMDLRVRGHFLLYPKKYNHRYKQTNIWYVTRCVHFIIFHGPVPCCACLPLDHPSWRRRRRSKIFAKAAYKQACPTITPPGRTSLFSSFRPPPWSYVIT